MSAQNFLSREYLIDFWSDQFGKYYIWDVNVVCKSPFLGKCKVTVTDSNKLVPSKNPWKDKVVSKLKGVPQSRCNAQFSNDNKQVTYTIDSGYNCVFSIIDFEKEDKISSKTFDFDIKMDPNQGVKDYINVCKQKVQRIKQG